MNIVNVSLIRFIEGVMKYIFVHTT